MTCVQRQLFKDCDLDSSVRTPATECADLAPKRWSLQLSRTLPSLLLLEDGQEQLLGCLRYSHTLCTQMFCTQAFVHEWLARRKNMTYCSGLSCINKQSYPVMFHAVLCLKLPSELMLFSGALVFAGRACMQCKRKQSEVHCAVISLADKQNSWDTNVCLSFALQDGDFVSFVCLAWVVWSQEVNLFGIDTSMQAASIWEMPASLDCHLDREQHNISVGKQLFSQKRFRVSKLSSGSKNRDSFSAKGTHL